MGSFNSKYEEWMNMHMSQATDERLRRLKHGHGFGEKLLLQQAWWPIVGGFDGLHPEYEFIDLHANYYYIDFAYLRLPKPTGLEADGFSAHARDADRHTFSRGLNRQNELLLADWNLIRFSVDQLKEDPRHCQSIIERMLEHWYGEEKTSMFKLSVYQKEILRLASRSANPITSEMASIALGKSIKFARSQLHELVEKGLLETASGEKRIHSYKLHKGRNKEYKQTN